MSTQAEARAPQAPRVEVGPKGADLYSGGDALKLDLQLCFPLYAASNLLTRLYRPLLAELGLTYPQYLAMLALWEQGRMSVGELGERLLLDSGTLTPLLKRLEAAGLVRRQRAADDERRVDLNLTEAGLALRERARRIPEALFCRLGMEPQALVELRTRLRALMSSLQRG